MSEIVNFLGIFLVVCTVSWFALVIVDALLVPSGGGLPDKARKDLLKKRKQK